MTKFQILRKMAGFIFFTIKNIIYFCKIVLCHINLKFRYRLNTDFVFKEDNICETLHILGNGPSVQKSLGLIRRKDVVLMVNFSVGSDLFNDLKPSYLCFADPVFFQDDVAPYLQRKKEDLIEKIRKINWPLTIIIPIQFKKYFSFSNNYNVNIRCVNSFFLDYNQNKFLYAYYKKNLCSPLFQNVVNMALYCGLQMSFRKIVLHGVDADSYKDISIDNDNQMVVHSKHFYGERKLIYSSEASYFSQGTLYKRLQCDVNMFRTYIELARYARYLGATVINASPGSMIDAFERYEWDKEGQNENLFSYRTKTKF